ncbi:E3 ubiquitin-protein ligase MARCHF3-like [Rhipicephalus sanguineus]|uniref:E3 ubiquitin-protein ligase MARCHF3-like n=1 Tax=Rhipicephalus sanguineus TaxID=34632 RepID=UPI001893E479|nr:E3 ubiquitin-protein ligase MARCHF3-like [Rhipicephalus sanguineus]
MPNDQNKNPNAETSASSLQSVPREEESCRVSWSSPSSSQCPEARSVRHSPYISNFTESSISPGVNDPPTFANSSLNGGDGDVARSKDDKVPPLGIPELVSDSENDPADDNVSLDKPTGSCNEDGSSEVMCRICREGVEEEPLVSPCSCSGTIGFMHVSCLEHWLNSQNVDVCELCGQRFPMAAQPRSVLRFFHYISQDGWLWRALLGDLLILFLLIMVTVILVAFMLQSLLSEERQWGSFVEWVSIGVILCYISYFLLCCYIGMFNKLRDWHHRFMAWQLAHPVRRIRTMPSARESTLGRPERNDERAAGDPATPSWRRRR